MLGEAGDADFRGKDGHYLVVGLGLGHDDPTQGGHVLPNLRVKVKVRVQKVGVKDQDPMEVPQRRALGAGSGV